MLRSFSKVLSLLYLTLALVWIGGLGIFAVTGESLYDAFWQVHQLPLRMGWNTISDCAMTKDKLADICHVIQSTVCCHALWG